MPEKPESDYNSHYSSDSTELSDESDTPRQKIGTFSSLKYGNFRLLFTGTTMSNAGQWIQQVTLSWLVYELTGSGTMIGTVNLVRSISAIAMIPLAGILIDRMNKKKLLMINNAWLFAITAGLGLLLLLGFDQIIWVFIFSLLAGFSGTIDSSLRQVLVFSLLPRSHTPNGMALIQTGWSIMRSFGPAIGGFLLAWSGAGGNFLIQAGLYVLIVVTITRIKFPERTYSVNIDSSPIENIKEGLRYIKGEKTIRTFMVLGFILPLLIIPVYTILPPIYAAEVFGDDSGVTQGFLMTAVGVGGIGGGFVLASLGHFERRGLLQLGSLFMVALSLIGFALSNNLPLALMFLAFSGFFELIFLTTNQTLMQLAIPDELRGRVTSVINLNMAIMPLGNLIAGIGSDLLGGPKWITIVFCCIVAVLVLLFFLFMPTIRNYRLSQGMKVKEPDTV